MPHLLFVFLDGVGLGPADPDRNPLARFDLPALARLGGGHAWTDRLPVRAEPSHVVRPLDATLGVEGLPQSGTGQATLFTGINCARVAGRHFGPFPHSRTRPLLDAQSLFHHLRAAAPEEPHPAAFANAYPPRFFTYARQRNRWTVTTRCCRAAGVRLRGIEDLQRGEALAADLTGHGWAPLDLPVHPIDEAEAARRLHRLGRSHTVTLFEYFLTDKAGHSQSFERAEAVLRSLERFFTHLIACLDPAEDLLLITSDHGNLEDLSTRSHTRHPVPLIALGHGAAAFAEAADLTDVAPAIVRLAGRNPDATAADPS